MAKRGHLLELLDQDAPSREPPAPTTPVELARFASGAHRRFGPVVESTTMAVTGPCEPPGVRWDRWCGGDRSHGLDGCEITGGERA
jgi:hypothetical protein